MLVAIIVAVVIVSILKMLDFDNSVTIAGGVAGAVVGSILGKNLKSD